MDPFGLLRLLWKYRKIAIPAIALALLAGGYVVFLGPRSYQASATYVVVNPDTPSAGELERDLRLARLNNNNPYLRATDQSLIVKVLMAKMASQEVQQTLKNAGLSTDYSVAPSPLSTMTVVVTATSHSPQVAVATRQWLLEDLVGQLKLLQTVAGADQRYLFAALPIDVAAQPVERVSSRLRALILVLVAGAIVAAAAVSVAASLDRMRETSARAQERAEETSDTGDEAAADVPAPVRRIPADLQTNPDESPLRNGLRSVRRSRQQPVSSAGTQSSAPSWDWDA